MASKIVMCSILRQSVTSRHWSMVGGAVCSHRRVCSTDSTAATLPLLTLYTKADCSLCDVAKDALSSHMHKFRFEEVDITAEGNKAWFDKYQYEIPVFHLNGQFLMKHKVNLKLLDHKLKALENS